MSCVPRPIRRCPPARCRSCRCHPPRFRSLAPRTGSAARPMPSCPSKAPGPVATALGAATPPRLPSFATPPVSPAPRLVLGPPCICLVRRVTASYAPSYNVAAVHSPHDAYLHAPCSFSSAALPRAAPRASILSPPTWATSQLHASPAPPLHRLHRASLCYSPRCTRARACAASTLYTSVDSLNSAIIHPFPYPFRLTYLYVPTVSCCFLLSRQ
ncbi:hypothetical protein DFH08DRAFT_908490 [Mycena albidolilacea]|uniref:Uncharacterized protein n=1 Tax=Mycena albidolilacea TaxID=1033008 RepID=A0AAD7E6Y0_9AGAR|nr:hypothetical protein DFH08DRAFT_908490 [Mycena albidolilacea]